MRVEAEPGFVLHVTPYRETSLLVDLFTRHQGRIRCVAKGFRKPLGLNHLLAGLRSSGQIHGRRALTADLRGALGA
ncbi:MAG: DNA repair protein RecO, partial [Porticoccaceae bacterium]